jgi:hypothetical protein
MAAASSRCSALCDHEIHETRETREHQAFTSVFVPFVHFVFFVRSFYVMLRRDMSFSSP